MNDAEGFELDVRLLPVAGLLHSTTRGSLTTDSKRAALDGPLAQVPGPDARCPTHGGIRAPSLHPGPDARCPTHGGV
jgi:hypothetical protein